MQYSKTFTLPAEGTTELTLGLDYVFVAASEKAAYIPVEIEIVDEAGVTLANNALRIPCMRGKNSIVKGAFLTKTGGDGIGVDSDYEGEINQDVIISDI